MRVCVLTSGYTPRTWPMSKGGENPSYTYGLQLFPSTPTTEAFCSNHKGCHPGGLTPPASLLGNATYINYFHLKFLTLLNGQWLGHILNAKHHMSVGKRSINRNSSHSLFVPFLLSRWPAVSAQSHWSRRESRTCKITAQKTEAHIAQGVFMERGERSI